MYSKYKSTINYNPWHGCHKISDGCKNCYVYESDEKYDKDSTIITKNKSFSLPIKKDRYGEYKIKSGTTLYTCMTSDFFLEEADDWRRDVWNMIKQRKDLHFVIITKRISRFSVSLPEDWQDAYDNVSIFCTVENQAMADIRLPLFLKLKIRNKGIVCSPLISDISLEKYLNKEIKEVVVAGESGKNARICNYDWVLNIRKQCIKNNIKFVFQQTGAKLMKDNKLYKIQRSKQHSQAQMANIDYTPPYKKRII